MPTPSSRDEELGRLLQSWQVEPRDDPALARKVWARIAAEKPRGLAAWLESLARLLAQPAAAVAAIALCAAAGALAAELQGTFRHEARLDRLAAEYAHSIDPLLMTPGAGDHAP